MTLSTSSKTRVGGAAVTKRPLMLKFRTSKSQAYNFWPMMKQSQMLHKVQVTPSYSGKEYLKLLDKVQSILCMPQLEYFEKL